MNNSVLCITTFNKKMYKDYAYGFMKTFNLPFDLVIYSEDNLDFLKNEYKFNFNIKNINELIPELKEFINRNKERNINDKKKFKMEYLGDAIRFSYKVFSVTHCGLNLDNKYKYLIWLDSDIMFKKSFDINFIENNFINEISMMSYLGRANNYSECGFLIFNLQHSKIKDYFNEMREMYVSNNIYNEKEYHDSYIWDIIRIKFENIYNVKNFNISNNTIHNDVFLNTPTLFTHFYHLKGNRKKDVIKYKKYFIN